MFKTILVPTDGSDHAKKAVAIAIDLAEKYQGKVIALHVMPSLESEKLPDELRQFAQAEHLGTTKREVLEAVAEQILQRVQAQASGDDAPPVDTLLETGDPATTILDVAKSQNADLVVMGSRGLSDIKGLLLGSVSHKVSQLCPCSCITVK